MNDETSKLIAKVERFARQEQLFASAEPGRALHLCAAVSGGADSMALLRVLLELREAFGYTLTACHVNHGLRGETADRDEAFARAECARLGVPLTVFRPADVGMAVPPHAGEDWARRLRYACFAQLLAGGIDCIATAHTATDQAETLLFRPCAASTPRQRKIWPASVKRQPARMPILPGRQNSCFPLHVWMQPRLPARPQKPRRHGGWSRCRALTRSFWKLRSTALLPRCGMPRKSTSACWQSWWSRGAGRCN